MSKADAARVLATWFGCGLVPKAPGTAGSLGALLPAVALSKAVTLDGAALALTGALLFGPAVWAADVTAREMRSKDPQVIVIDEVVGQCITFAGATHLNWKSWVAGFVLFRVFDMTKPFPIRRLEGLPGGLGIVADDAAAGVYAAVVLFLMGWFNLY
jgi:phosphatidylglycerophosphatase A